MIPQAFIEELLARVDLVEVVGAHVRLRKSGANYAGLCPFHAEKTASFTVSATKQFYHCFGCGAHGTAIGFLMEHLGLGYGEAIEELARRQGLAVPREGTGAVRPDRSRKQALHALLDTAMQYYKRRLKESERAIAYLKGRGVEGRTAALYGLGYAPKAWNALQAAIADYDGSLAVDAGLVIEAAGDEDLPPAHAGHQAQAATASGLSVVHLHHGDSLSGQSPDGDGAVSDQQQRRSRRRWDRFRDRVMFPIRDQAGLVIGFGGRILDQGEPKYLNSPETSVFSKGKEIYGLFEARDGLRRENTVLVVEGYMDVVVLAQHGIDFAVATLGTALTREHLAKLLRRVDRIVFAFDGDSAGRTAAWKALELSLPVAVDGKRFAFLFLPEEHDPDSFVRAHGGEGMRDALQRSEPLSRVLVGELVTRHGCTSAEDRSALLTEAVDYLRMLPAAALRIQIAHEVAELTGISVHELNLLLQRPPPRGSARRGEVQAGGQANPARVGTRLPSSPGSAPDACVDGANPEAPWEATTPGTSGTGAPRTSPDAGTRAGPGSASKDSWSSSRADHRRPARAIKGPGIGVVEKAVIAMLAHPPLARRFRDEESFREFVDLLPPDLEKLLAGIEELHKGIEELHKGRGNGLSPPPHRQPDPSTRIPASGDCLAQIDYRLEILCAADPALWVSWRPRLQRSMALVAVLDEEAAWAELVGALRQLVGRVIREEIDRLASEGLSSPAQRDRYAFLSARQKTLRHTALSGHGG